jgi:acyl-coenzyme A synthetase/AMP-(fatty) acid ligase
VFAGRRDGVVNVGGQKVFPEEVEAVLNQHPSVRMSRVSARRNAITGAVVSAEIVPVAAAVGLVAELGRFCADRLPRHKVPVSITIVPSLEIAPSGKLVRRHA